MSLLSDLFTELDQYRFVFGHMKALFTIRSHLESVNVGNIIYTLLKCTAILGIVSAFKGILLSKRHIELLLTQSEIFRKN